jgi:DNA-directed RNA polymerase specialized sigma24 family protein
MLAFVHEDKACFDEPFNRYRQPIYAFYSRRVTDRAQAEELMQEAFLPLLHAASRYEQCRSISDPPFCDSVPESRVSFAMISLKLAEEY